MFSALEQIGMKSPPPAAKKTRQMTLQTAFSRVNNRNTAAASKHASSTPPSMTTGTSNTDNSSELNDDTNKLENKTRLEDNTRISGRASSSIYSGDEDSLITKYLTSQDLTTKEEPSTHGNLSTQTSLSTQKVHSTPKRRVDMGRRGTSRVTTPIAGEAVSPEQLLHRSIKTLDEEWDVNTIPVDNLEMSAPEPPKLKEKRRVSTRLDVLQRASTAVEKSKSVLGKRVRETSESRKEQAAALYGMTSSRLRSREPKLQTPAPQGSASKKVRLTERGKQKKLPEPVVQKNKAKKLSKTWLDQGLYVGQNRDFNPKLTEAQNKKRNAMNPSERKPFMPLPMYSGQKALEQGRNFRLPYEVFSPLPPGQPKPDEWKKVQKSKSPSRSQSRQD